MPWTEVSIVDERREFVCLARQEGANVSALCGRYGISRQMGYKWLRRARDPQEDFTDRSRAPHCQPKRTSPGLERAILKVRDAHPAWGSRKIAHCLVRDGLQPPALSTIHAILERHDRIRPKDRHRHSHCRFAKQEPNQLWQMDFKGHVTIGGKVRCHPFCILDDHSRFSICLSACENERTVTVKPLLVRAFQRYGLPSAIYVDNGSPWGCGVPGSWTELGVWLLKLGIAVIHGQPYHPQGRGKIERSHRTLKAEVFSTTAVSDMSLAQMQARFDHWRMIYNIERPHEALNMDVPANLYQPSPRDYPAVLPQVEYDAGEILRRVGTSKAYISFRNRLWKVPQPFRGEILAVRPRARQGQYNICFGATTIARIDLNE